MYIKVIFQDARLLGARRVAKLDLTRAIKESMSGQRNNVGNDWIKGT